MGLKETYDSVSKSVYEVNQTLDRIGRIPEKWAEFKLEVGHAITDISFIAIFTFLMWFLFKLTGKKNFALIVLFLGIVQILHVLIKLF